MKSRLMAILVGIATAMSLSYAGLEGYIERRGQQVVAGIYNSDRVAGWSGTPGSRSARATVSWTVKLSTTGGYGQEYVINSSHSFWVDLSPWKKTEITFTTWKELRDLCSDKIREALGDRYGEQGLSQGLATVGINRRNFSIAVEARLEWNENGCSTGYRDNVITFAGSYPGYLLDD